ncbi:hypothetical protein B0H17DRAFT_214219 [Mycena rosella]|uniref:F-box domain-containing protein n=1 Tax=Mycena rosella TaxID=1033263 RepID=A0AAD7DWJ7_MYCRO|nr:hypothetical protein B0H17DRAFT_214219 [Mycena rosella]
MRLRYEVVISRLQALLESAEEDRAVLQARYNDCRALLAPIRRLPSEILAGIFVSFSTISHPATYSGWMSRLAQAPLLTVFQVCARWHAVVIGTSHIVDHDRYRQRPLAHPLSCGNNDDLARGGIKPRGQLPTRCNGNNRRSSASSTCTRAPNGALGAMEGGDIHLHSE